MRYLILLLLILVIAGCQSERWVFEPCTTYGDAYLTTMSSYVCMLNTWHISSNDLPPAPQPPGQTHTGRYPYPAGGSGFMGGYMQGYAVGAQAGAIMLQNARNEAYSVALNRYYTVVAAINSKDKSF